MHVAIVGNGPFLPKSILKEALKNKIVLALDGAAEKLVKLGFAPDIILGDFDSLSKEAQTFFKIQKTFTDLTDIDPPYSGAHDTLIVPAKNQNDTDMQKAIKYCDSQEMTAITIICASGGRLDHHESVMRVLRTSYRSERPLLLHTEQQTLRFAKNETVAFSGQLKDKCGILAYPKAQATSQGLVYELQNFPLEFGFSDSTCNILKAEKVVVQIAGDALLIMPPQLDAQRFFMQQTISQRLNTLTEEALQYQRPMP